MCLCCVSVYVFGCIHVSVCVCVCVCVCVVCVHVCRKRCGSHLNQRRSHITPIERQMGLSETSFQSEISKNQSPKNTNLYLVSHEKRHKLSCT